RSRRAGANRHTPENSFFRLCFSESTMWSLKLHKIMQTVGLRELKNRLSHYIRRVRDGQLVIVTDRGQVVAELGPPGQIPAGTKIDPAVARLVNRGLLVPGARN